MVGLEIPAQDYVKFTNGPEQMPDVIVDIWKKVWTMTDSDLGGIRSYLIDFTIYDERAINPESTTVDLFIGIKK